MPKLTENDVAEMKRIAQPYKAEGLIVVAFKPDGSWDAKSWGRSERLCNQYGQVLDRVVRGFQDGLLDGVGV